MRRASTSSVSSARVVELAAPLATLPPCFVRWVAASAPGLPLPFDRELPSNRCSSRPTAPLPPTGLNRSNPPSVSVSSPSSSSCRISLSVWRGTCLAFSSSGGARLAGPDMAWVDGAEERRRVRDRLLAPRDGEGLGRRRRASRHRRIDQRPDRRWDEVAARTWSARWPSTARYRWVTRPRRSRLPRISGARLPAATSAAWIGDDPQLVDRTKAVVDEHDRAVGPRTLTGVGGRHRQGRAGDGRAQELQPGQVDRRHEPRLGTAKRLINH